MNIENVRLIVINVIPVITFIMTLCMTQFKKMKNLGKLDIVRTMLNLICNIISYNWFSLFNKPMALYIGARNSKEKLDKKDVYISWVYCIINAIVLFFVKGTPIVFYQALYIGLVNTQGLFKKDMRNVKVINSIYLLLAIPAIIYYKTYVDVAINTTLIIGNIIFIIRATKEKNKENLEECQQVME